ncbi:MAG: hypothetical protein SWC40_11490 [Thermodesulfobacteriota bacterium]|nr:hypothetical protein [Thermodesulfobacteriota bacterium]
MQKGKESKFSVFGLDPTLGLGDKVIDHVEEAGDEEKKKLQKSDYYAFCPKCGKKQIKKDLIENGCFICGWKRTEEELRLAKAKSQSGQGKARMETRGYKTICPNCGATFVTEEFLQNGCWRCGCKE